MKFWNLTPVGDWNSFTENTVTQNRTHGNAHEILTMAASSLIHDAKGNIVTNSLGHAYQWDTDNHMTSANIPTGSSSGTEGTHSYTYDALGRRVSKTVGSTTTVFVCSTNPIPFSQDAGQVIAEYPAGTTATTPTEKYAYATYIDEPILKTGTGGTAYYHRNQQFSITALTDAAGTIIERYTYTAYGLPTILNPTATTTIATSTVNNPYQYTARRLDNETTLNYFRARYYDSVLGRFIGRDPLGYIDGESLYPAYFAPGELDPTGQCPPALCSNWPPIPPPVDWDYMSTCVKKCTQKNGRLRENCRNWCRKEARDASRDKGAIPNCEFEFSVELKLILQKMKDRLKACCKSGEWRTYGNACYGYAACINAINLSSPNYEIDTHGGKLWWGGGGVVDQGYLITDRFGNQLYVHANPRGLGLCPTFRVDCYPSSFIWE